jgi:hypothetical protein
MLLFVLVADPNQPLNTAVSALIVSKEAWPSPSAR